MSYVPRTIGVVVAILAIGLPYITQDAYFVQVASFMGIYVILAISLQLLYGYTGQISFAHAGFYGIGAYTAVVLHGQRDVNFLVAVVAALLLTGVIAFIVGIPTLRLRGHYLAIATLALQMSIHQFFIQARTITNGTIGIFGIERPHIFGLTLANDLDYYQFIAVIAVLTFLFAQRLVTSRFGRSLLAVREDEVAASVTGISPFRYKVIIFSISAMLAGLGGVLFGFQLLFISPDSFGLDFSIIVLSMVVIGGVGSTVGAVLGAATVTLVTQALFTAGDLQFLIYGAFIVLVMVFFPGGLVGLGRSLISARGRRHFASTTVARGGANREKEVVGSDVR